MTYNEINEMVSAIDPRFDIEFYNDIDYPKQKRVRVSMPHNIFGTLDTSEDVSTASLLSFWCNSKKKYFDMDISEQIHDAAENGFGGTYESRSKFYQRMVTTKNNS